MSVGHSSVLAQPAAYAVPACGPLTPSRAPAVVLTCRSSSGGVCPVTSGEQTIERLGLGELSIAANAGILLAFIVICRLVAYLGIRFLKW